MPKKSSASRSRSRHQKRNRTNRSQGHASRKGTSRDSDLRIGTRELTDEELQNLATLARERQGYEEFRKAMKCHGLSRNAILRTKRRENYYLAVKSFLLYLQTICVLLVGLMAIIVYIYIKQDDQSYYYVTQASIELILLIVAFSIVLFENVALHYFMVLLFLTTFFFNILTITYYVLFDEVATGCMKLAGFKYIVCLSSHLPAQHHTIYCAMFLALLHFLAFAVAMYTNYLYTGTLTHLIEISRALEFQTCHTHKTTKRKTRRSRRRRRRRRFGTEVDLSKLAVGTVITTERSTSYKWRGNVQPGGVVVGSGVESMTDSVTLQAPTKEAVKRDSKLVRHVMVDAVEAKMKPGGVVVPAKKRVSRGRRALQRKPSKLLVNHNRSPERGTLKAIAGLEYSDLETITFNSLMEMDQRGSPCAYLCEKSEKKKKAA